VAGPFRVDPRSAEPIFDQLAFQVKRAVAEGRLREGDRLPSVRELARDLAVNPNTVLRAIESLERDGVIVRRQGAGCFVTGRGSELDGRARRGRLDAALRRAVTEAFHLGFDRDQIRTAFERSLENLDFERRPG
jgi:GntR family transcriptional regulator